MIYKLQPILKHRLWGGQLLTKQFEPTNQDSIGEAWILSCLGQDNNPIGNNLTLQDLFLQNKDIVQKGWKKDFPILIKLIDAQKDLSIQVHPQAKTEFWYILNQQPSYLYLGFSQDTNSNQVKQLVQNNQILSILNKPTIKYGDCFLINPGTIHAIGQKTFLIEIQQNVDLTYRLYDFGRKDQNGQLRPLHIDQSLACLNYQKHIVQQNRYDQLLVKTTHFKVHKIDVDGEINLICDETSFHCLTNLGQDCLIKSFDQTIQLKYLESVFIPAGQGQYCLVGTTTIIQTTL